MSDHLSLSELDEWEAMLVKANALYSPNAVTTSVTRAVSIESAITTTSSRYRAVTEAVIDKLPTVVTSGLGDLMSLPSAVGVEQPVLVTPVFGVTETTTGYTNQEAAIDPPDAFTGNPVSDMEGNYSVTVMPSSVKTDEYVGTASAVASVMEFRGEIPMESKVRDCVPFKQVFVLLLSQYFIPMNYKLYAIVGSGVQNT